MTQKYYTYFECFFIKRSEKIERKRGKLRNLNDLLIMVYKVNVSRYLEKGFGKNIYIFKS